MRLAYGDYLEAHMLAAELATKGTFRNARGRAAGITQEQLFMGGPSITAAYASEELLDFWRLHPRMTLAQYERAWVEQQTQTPYDWGTPAAA